MDVKLSYAFPQENHKIKLIFASSLFQVPMIYLAFKVKQIWNGIVSHI